MVMRRQLLLGTALSGVITPALLACSSDKSEQEAAYALRQPATLMPGDVAAVRRELVRYATLARRGYFDVKSVVWTAAQKEKMLLFTKFDEICFLSSVYLGYLLFN